AAQYQVAYMYFKGVDGVYKNYKLSRYWLEKSSAQENERAKLLLAKFYIKGYGLERNYIIASKLYQDLLDSHDYYRRSEVLFELANMYRYGLGVDRDFGKAIKLYKSNIHNGNAFICLGVMSYLGQGMEQSYSKAYKCFTRFNDGVKPEHLCLLGV